MANNIAAVQLYNPVPLYIRDFVLTYNSGTLLTVGTGICRDSTNVTDIQLSSTQTINTASSGALGLDTGTISNNTVYYVYAIRAQLGINTPDTVILSASVTSPLLPSSYNVYRRIGSILTDNTGNIRQFCIEGFDNSKFVLLDSSITIMNALSATTFTTVNLVNYVPFIDSTSIFVNFLYTPSSASNYARVRDLLSTETTNTSVVLKSSAAASASFPVVRTRTRISGSQIGFQYIVTSGDTLTANMVGYMENL